MSDMTTQLTALTFAALLTVAPCTARADTHNTPTPMTTNCTANGAVIKLRDGTTFYLGKSCDAARKSRGTSKW